MSKTDKQAPAKASKPAATKSEPVKADAAAVEAAKKAAAAKAEADAAKKLAADEKAKKAAAKKAEAETLKQAKAAEAAKAKTERDAKRAEAAKAIAAAKQAEADAKAKLKAARDAARAAGGGGSTKGPEALRTYASNYVHDTAHKTPAGNPSVHCGDDIAKKFAGKSLDEIYPVVAKAIEESEADLRKKYGHLNPGMQRMNLGNRMRGVVNAK